MFHRLNLKAAVSEMDHDKTNAASCGQRADMITMLIFLSQLRDVEVDRRLLSLERWRDLVTWREAFKPAARDIRL